MIAEVAMMLDDDLWLLVQFLLDTVCMMPSIPERASPERIGVLATLAIAIALPVVYVKSVFADVKADIFVRVFFVFIGAFMILGAPVLAMEWQLIVSLVAPCVVLLRLGEGVLLGMWFACLTSPQRRLLASTLLGLFLLAFVAGPHITAIVKNTWAVLGAGVSAYLWTNPIREEGGAEFSSGLSLAGFFVIFVAAQFLVSAVPFWASLHRWAVPAGALLGTYLMKPLPRG